MWIGQVAYLVGVLWAFGLFIGVGVFAHDRLELVRDMFLAAALAIGGVLALANIEPAQCLAIRELALAGDWSQAREIQVRLIEANTAVTSRFGVAGLKAAMNMVGLPNSFVRPPLLDLKDPDIGQLKSILIAAQILKT